MKKKTLKSKRQKQRRETKLIKRQEQRRQDFLDILLKKFNPNGKRPKKIIDHNDDSIEQCLVIFHENKRFQRELLFRKF